MIDLVWLGQAETRPEWPLGRVVSAKGTPAGVYACVEQHLGESKARAWLFWDEALGAPRADGVRTLLEGCGDVWHAGLRLGMGGQPRVLDYVAPLWPLSRDPDTGMEATSWRLSLRACLIRREILVQLGAVRPEFQSLEGASLELGHRYIRHGVLTRHVPWLVPGDFRPATAPLPFEDELRFAACRFGRRWARWAQARALMRGHASLAEVRRAARAVRQSTPGGPWAPYHRPPPTGPVLREAAPQVTALIPTVDRYSYLRTLLAQLRRQTVAPCQIIVVDQTDPSSRDLRLAQDYADLPLQVLYQDEPGQCSSRNAGLVAARGDYILFLDDDVEVEPGLIQQHLENLTRFGAEVSSGVAEEVGAGPLPPEFTFLRVSDVFPAGNTLVRKAALARSGLFDLAYDRGQRADGDLGMRLYLAGALMILDPRISVLHHRAPSGGLRKHRARVVTYASSRTRLTHRQILSATEVYFAHRYFSARHFREARLQNVLATFSIRGGAGRRLLKALVGLVCLPATLRRLHQNEAQARTMLAHYPIIPRLGAPLEPAGTGPGSAW